MRRIWFISAIHSPASVISLRNLSAYGVIASARAKWTLNAVSISRSRIKTAASRSQSCAIIEPGAELSAGRVFPLDARLA